MKVIVVGLGSMGKRRIRLLQKTENEITIIGVDANPERIQEAKSNFGICCQSSIKEALASQDIDGAFVCTSPLSHYPIIKELLEAEVNVFTELNLVSDGYPELIKLARDKNRILFLSSTFLYRKDIQALIARVEGKTVNYSYHTGQYLPDWHPWENYKDYFVADVRTNGCREIMAIEFPWLSKCFGKIDKVTVVKKQNLTKLELGYCDNYLLILEHETGNKGMVAVDVVSRKARRNLEIFGEDVHLFWDGTPESLSYLDMEDKEVKSIATYDAVDKDIRYCDNIIEDAYMDEILGFLYWIQNNSKKYTFYSFEEDMEILKLIDYIENGGL